MHQRSAEFNISPETLIVPERQRGMDDPFPFAHPAVLAELEIADRQCREIESQRQQAKDLVLAREREQARARERRHAEWSND